MADVELHYARDGKEVTSTGVIQVKTGESVERTDFHTVSFRRMLICLCNALRALPLDQIEAVRLIRTDRQQPVFSLSPAMIQLLRDNPPAALQMFQATSDSPTRIRQQVTARTLKEIQPAVLTVGIDYRAQYFGERVYIRLRLRQEKEVECPGCGFWETVQDAILQCTHRCKERFPLEMHTRWAGVLVEDLLKTGRPSFYLPRPWNQGKSWISREDLENRYRAFQKERDDHEQSAQH